MKFRFKHAAAAAIAGLLLSAAPSAEATITFTEGGADIFFLYDSEADTWVTTFRAKGPVGGESTTGATGLTNPFNADSTPSTWTGILGNEPTSTPGNTGDYFFDSLQINVSSAPLHNVGGTNYFITPANGSGLYSASSLENSSMALTNPDLGIRFRLRENQDAMGIGTGTSVDQFADFRMTLDWEASTKPDGAQFVMLDRDDLSVRFETSSDTLSYDFGKVWGHDHVHYGFSVAGDYALVFKVEGIGGLYGDSEGPQVTMNFNVIPEPSTALLSMFAIGALGLRRRRN